MVSAMEHHESPMKTVTTSFAEFEFSPRSVRPRLDLLRCPVAVSPAALVLGAERVPKAHREQALQPEQQVGKFTKG